METPTYLREGKSYIPEYAVENHTAYGNYACWDKNRRYVNRLCRQKGCSIDKADMQRSLLGVPAGKTYCQNKLDIRAAQ